MSVKNEKADKPQEEITDDISDKQIEDDGVDQDKLAELKAMMAKKHNKPEEKMPARIVEKKRKSLNFGIVGTGQAGCVGGDTNIMVSPKGILPIREFFAEVLENANIADISVTGDGSTCIKLPYDTYTVSIDPETGEIVKGRINAVWKLKKIASNSITTSSGTSLVCSKKHRSLVFEPQTRRRAFYRSLSSTKPISAGDRFIDVRQHVVDEISTDTYIRGLTVNEDVAWVLGLFAGDGSTAKSGNEISFYISCTDTISKLSRILSVLPGVSSVAVTDQLGCKKVAVYGLPIRIFFESAFGIFNGKTSGGAGSKTFIIDVPRCVSAAKSSVRAAFLAGLIDADGTVCKDWCESSVSTVSGALADKLGCLISSIGGRSTVEKTEPRKDGESEGYRVRISGKLNHGPMMGDIVGFLADTKKKSRLSKWKDGDQKSFITSSVPITFNEVSSWMTDGGMKTPNSLFEKTGVCLKSWARGERKLSVLSFDRALCGLDGSEQIEYVRAIAPKLDEVDHVVTGSEKEVVFYDLTVEKYENYLAGNNGFIFTHNSRIAEAFHKLGYGAVAFNTAPQDLEQIGLPEDSKYLLEYGIGGAAKDVEVGHDAAETHREGIANVVADHLGDAQVLVLCLSLGGGSGAGSHDVMIDVLSETGKPIVVMTVLPMSTEGAKTKQNSLNTLSSLSKLTQDKTISNLIVVDNAKLEAIYSDVSHMDFFSVGNKAIVDPIDKFNYFSSMSSLDKPFDPMEWAKVFVDGEGLCIYGEMTVTDYADDNTAITKAVIAGHEDGLLASGFDLEQAKYASILIVGNEKVWKNIPRGSVDYALSVLQERCPGAEEVYHGTYVSDEEEDVVKVYSIFSGLGLPDSRVSQLRKEVDVEQSKTKERAKSRGTNLTLDTGKDKVVSKADEVRAKIAKNGSTFAQNFAKGKVMDYRKK